ncbi:hypothetical protein NQ317_008467 [Molorchus minor]|uniref:Fatty acid synthase n=1 Tax=Molorchus minor TaxID=1323400 RepID=A0ABQ9JFM8_9CUCU|nr:hypothetical protein NQ317_008467 [Molorchus minor]
METSHTGRSKSVKYGSISGYYAKLPRLQLSESSSGINSTTYITANNISYTFDFHGPSCGVDAGCSSSIYAMNQAVDSIRLGVCDAAVVCSAHANFLPYDSMEFTKLGVLSPDGRCKTFDDDRNGYVKSEAVVAIFLQKRETARRIYATVSGIGCNVDGYKEDGLTHPSSRMQISLLRDIYQRYAINSDEVTCVECHGTGTLVGDIRECEALDEFFFSTKRTTPLRIGSVKTNVGHTEAAGGLVSLVKLLIVIQTEVIPANLHFESPAVDIPAVFNGKLEVVSQNTKYTGGLLALNSFGLGGANGHLVISPYSKLRRNNDDIKARSYIRLIRVSGRTNEAVEYILNKVNENREDADFLSLVDSTFSTEIKNHGYRGYINLDSSKRYISRCPSRNRPIWFSYSGMGSQWPKMGNDLVKFEVFRDTLKKCATALKPYDLDLENLVVNGTAEMFEDPVNCFTSIIALSVGLTDLLYSLEIKPDGIFGHSLGEIVMGGSRSSQGREKQT